MPGKKRRLNKQPDTPASVLTSRPKTSLLAKPSRILENILFSQQVESLCSSLPLRPENDPYWAEFAMEQLCRVMKSSDRYNVKEVLDLRYRFSRYWPVDETIMYFIAREMCKVYGRENLNSNVILAMIHEVSKLPQTPESLAEQVATALPDFDVNSFHAEYLVSLCEDAELAASLLLGPDYEVPEKEKVIIGDYEVVSQLDLPGRSPFFYITLVCLHKPTGAYRQMTLLLTSPPWTFEYDGENRERGAFLREIAVWRAAEGVPGIFNLYDAFTDLSPHESYDTATLQSCHMRRSFIHQQVKEAPDTVRVVRRVAIVTDVMLPHEKVPYSPSLRNLHSYTSQQHRFSVETCVDFAHQLATTVYEMHARNICNLGICTKTITVDIDTEKVFLTQLQSALIFKVGNKYQARQFQEYCIQDIKSIGTVLYGLTTGTSHHGAVLESQMTVREKAATLAMKTESKFQSNLVHGLIVELMLYPHSFKISTIKAKIERVLSAFRPCPDGGDRQVPTASSKVEPQEDQVTELPDLMKQVLYLHSKPSNELVPEEDEDPPKSSPEPMKVTNCPQGPRPLTSEEYRLYGPIVNKKKKQNATNLSSTGQALLKFDDKEEKVNIINDSQREFHDILMSSTSKTFETLSALGIERDSQNRIEAELDRTVPVMEQEHVIDLRSEGSGGPRRRVSSRRVFSGKYKSKYNRKSLIRNIDPRVKPPPQAVLDLIPKSKSKSGEKPINYSNNQTMDLREFLMLTDARGVARSDQIRMSHDQQNQ